MKQMEYTIKMVTHIPVEPDAISRVLHEAFADEVMASAIVTNYRVLPAKKSAKPEAVRS